LVSLIDPSSICQILSIELADKLRERPKEAGKSSAQAKRLIFDDLIAAKRVLARL
jgi:hypothetical protein